MRLILLFICSGIFNCFAQKPAGDLCVTYQLYFDGARKTTYPAILFVKDNVTLYEMKSSLSAPWNGKDVSEDSSVAMSSKNKADMYLKINHNSKELLTFGPLPGSSQVLIKDNYPEIKWNITKESKTISGYSCTKATCVYRGREWEAWFTPEIAVPYGPWKLHGLPGLILEVNSADNKYIMKVTKVEKTKSDIFEKDFKALKTTYNKTPITYQQFLKDEQEAFVNMMAKMRSEGINVSGGPPPPNGYELKYEWE